MLLPFTWVYKNLRLTLQNESYKISIFCILVWCFGTNQMFKQFTILMFTRYDWFSYLNSSSFCILYHGTGQFRAFVLCLIVYSKNYRIGRQREKQTQKKEITDTQGGNKSKERLQNEYIFLHFVACIQFKVYYIPYKRVFSFFCFKDE